MKTSISYKQIWRIAYPIILGSIAQNLINVTDTAFLGRVGEIALGAGAIGGLFYLAVIMLGFGFGIGSQIIIARRLGEGDNKQIGVVFVHTVTFLIVLAIVVFAVMKFVSPHILSFAINSEPIYDGSIDFLRVRAFGIFFAFVNVSFRSYYVGIAKTKVITYTTIVLAIVNIVLDYLLIFGKFGMPEMGIRGAALASVLAEISAMVYFVLYTIFINDYRKYDLFNFSVLSISSLQKIFKVSIPMMIQQFVSLSVWFVFFLFVEKIGEKSLAVSNIIRSIYVIVMIPIWGFSTATNTLVSYLIGIKRENEVMSLVFRIVVICFVSVFILVSVLLFFPRAIMEVYTNQPELIDMGVPVLYIICGGALSMAIGFVIFNAVSGTGNTRTSLVMELTVLAIYVGYTYFVIIRFNGGLLGAWTAEMVYGSLLAIFSIIYLKSNIWKKTTI